MSQTDSTMLAVPVNESDHVMGPTSAPITVVNYGVPVSRLSKDSSLNREASS